MNSTPNLVRAAAKPKAPEADWRATQECKNGWGCHGRKSRKCPFLHPENVEGGRGASPPARDLSGAPAEVREGGAPAPEPKSPEADWRATQECKHGWGCHGRKSRKCPFRHPERPPKHVEDPVRA
jgi:hypothetical protein